MAERGSGMATFSLTPRQREELERRWKQLQGPETWHGDLPVLLLDRSWLRLSCLPVRELFLRLPPDASREAPELVRYRELVAAGHPPWQAQQLCWEDFGPEACRAAQLRLWSVQEGRDHLWRLEDYLELIREYRHRFRQERPRSLPLLTLPRHPCQQTSGNDGLKLHWLQPGPEPPERPIRHTCA